MVYPDVSPTWAEVGREPDGTARDAINELAEKLDNLKPGRLKQKLMNLGEYRSCALTIKRNRFFQNGDQHWNID